MTYAMTPPPSWCLYALQCSDGTLYTGVTIDAPRRLRQHNGELVGGAKYTRSRRPVRLVYLVGHPTRSSAQRAEAAFKKLGRSEKLRIIRDQKAEADPQAGGVL